MKRLLMLAGLILVLAYSPLHATAQMQSDEKMLVGQVQSVDESGTRLTLTDGTTLLTPPGKRLEPGALGEGMMVVAGYREDKDGRKFLTKLIRKQSERAPGTPSESPK